MQFKVNVKEKLSKRELIAFLSARTVYNLPLTFQTTTGVNEDVSGGQIFYYKKPCWFSIWNDLIFIGSGNKALTSQKGNELLKL